MSITRAMEMVTMMIILISVRVQATTTNANDGCCKTCEDRNAMTRESMTTAGVVIARVVLAITTDAGLLLRGRKSYDQGRKVLMEAFESQSETLREGKSQHPEPALSRNRTWEQISTPLLRCHPDRLGLFFKNASWTSK